MSGVYASCFSFRLSLLYLSIQRNIALKVVFGFGCLVVGLGGDLIFACTYAEFDQSPGPFESSFSFIKLRFRLNNSNPILGPLETSEIPLRQLQACFSLAQLAVHLRYFRTRYNRNNRPGTNTVADNHRDALDTAGN